MPKQRRYSHAKRWGSVRSAAGRICPKCNRKGALRHIVIRDVETDAPERAGWVCHWKDCGYKRVYWYAG